MSPHSVIDWSSLCAVSRWMPTSSHRFNSLLLVSGVGAYQLVIALLRGVMLKSLSCTLCVLFSFSPRIIKAVALSFLFWAVLRQQLDLLKPTCSLTHDGGVDSTSLCTPVAVCRLDLLLMSDGCVSTSPPQLRNLLLLMADGCAVFDLATPTLPPVVFVAA